MKWLKSKLRIASRVGNLASEVRCIQTASIQELSKRVPFAPYMYILIKIN